MDFQSLHLDKLFRPPHNYLSFAGVAQQNGPARGSDARTRQHLFERCYMSTVPFSPPAHQSPVDLPLVELPKGTPPTWRVKVTLKVVKATDKAFLVELPQGSPSVWLPAKHVARGDVVI